MSRLRWRRSRFFRSFFRLFPAAAAVILITVSFFALCASGAGAQIPRPTEYQLKAAFLYNFVKYVEWPPQALPANSPTIIIGVYGKDPFGPALNTISGKIVDGKRLVIKPCSDPQDLRSVHLLFISPSEKRRLKQILSILGNASILTVSEIDGFSRSGGIINLFTTESNRVRFEINPDSAERARLRISSQLLRVAKVVRG